jgi:hypothetical protein
MMVNARQQGVEIMIVCPHCLIGSRYDASYVEDVIKIRHDIICVACGETFNLVVSMPDPHGPTLRAPDAPEQNGRFCACNKIAPEFVAYCGFCEKPIRRPS